MNGHRHLVEGGMSVGLRGFGCACDGPRNSAQSTQSPCYLLVQVRSNPFPEHNPPFTPDYDPDFYWALEYFACQDSNYNVLGLMVGNNYTADVHWPAMIGDLAERYEYSPYGRRTVYRSSGIHDPDCQAPIYSSRRLDQSDFGWSPPPLPLNPLGHQGLLHEEELGVGGGLIQNRHRVLHSDLVRFMQRDPYRNNMAGGGYQDGLNVYQYVRASPTKFTDPYGDRVPNHCCGGKPYNPLSQCCENKRIANKVPVWVCFDAWVTDGLEYWPDWLMPYWLEAGHSTLCCDGPWRNCFGKNDKVKKSGDDIPKDSYPSGAPNSESYCTKKMVCPKTKDSKCNSPKADCGYSTFWNNCHSWAWDE